MGRKDKSKRRRRRGGAWIEAVSREETRIFRPTRILGRKNLYLGEIFLIGRGQHVLRGNFFFTSLASLKCHFNLILVLRILVNICLCPRTIGGARWIPLYYVFDVKDQRRSRTT